jgi:hypothetical protein
VVEMLDAGCLPKWVQAVLYCTAWYTCLLQQEARESAHRGNRAKAHVVTRRTRVPVTWMTLSDKQLHLRDGEKGTRKTQRASDGFKKT